MSESKTVINLEEFIGKTVGRRRPPNDPMEMGFAMQATTNQLLQSFGHKLSPKGVFRFRTHEEANAWMEQMIRPRKAN